MDTFTIEDIPIDVLRLDRLHPIVSGNKWFKLKGHLQKALETPGAPILTFGGAWSNHIVATAFAAKEHNLSSIGIIRGEKPHKLSVTLKDALAYGMHLEFISRENYARKEEPDFLNHLAGLFPGAYIIPEGGGGEAGILGCKDILKNVDTTNHTHILCAIGTGTTFLGLAQALRNNQQLIGVPVLKGLETLSAIDLGGYLAADLQTRCQLLSGYHFGGYARHPQPLLDFMNRFYLETAIPSDIVYTGKLFFALQDAIRKSFFPASSRLLVIHSGGLQGNRSLSPGKLIF
ncbi:MAG: pyridoxal-phosphate dependent enzyme [Bacteroidetes bacterium]|nr:pyridoxal-phosphate dependent enzyme [Bacteroidota bacterium]